MRSFLKYLLPIEKFRSILIAVDRCMLPLFASNRLLSSLYFCLFSRRFGREHQSVLKGRIAYFESLKAPESSSVMLRRNIHRLEKGIIMQPRRDHFAEGYISETVQRFMQCCKADALNADERQWAEEVLQQYFCIVADSPVISAARQQFLSVVEQRNAESLSAVPYEHRAIVPANIEFEQFNRLCRQRRSVRWFQDKPVPRDLIEKALSAATQAPSACNRQPFEFFVFDKPEEARKIGAIPMGTNGFSHNFQCTVVVVGDLASYPYERDRHVIYIDGSLAAMQFMLALETLGLSSCVINWPDVEILEQKMIKTLGLTMDQRPVMVISIGYAASEGMIPYSQKKTAKDLIKEVVL